MADAWVSPNNFTDPNSKWNLEANAYDEDTGTRATTLYNGATDWLELHIPAVNGTIYRPVSKIRLHAVEFCLLGNGAPTEHYYDPRVSLSYYGFGSHASVLGWHTIMSDQQITKSTWVEILIGTGPWMGSTYALMSKIKIRWATKICAGSIVSNIFWLNEFDFYVVDARAHPVVDGGLIERGLMGKGLIS